MDDLPNPRFAAWMKAEHDAYDAIHQLNQSTQGGRLEARTEALGRIRALRRAADLLLAELCRTEPALPRAASVADHGLTPRPFTRSPAAVGLSYKH